MSMIGYFFRADDDMVKKLQEGDSGEFMFREEHRDDILDIDKTWHAIHYTLTEEVWEVPEDNILAQLVLGGEPVNEEDMGYGPARLIPKEVVAQLANAVEEWDEAAFREKFNVKDMIEKEVYPLMEDEDEEQFFQYVWEYFNALKQFIKETAAKGLHVIAFIA